MPKITASAALAVFVIFGGIAATAALLPFLPTRTAPQQTVYAPATSVTDLAARVTELERLRTATGHSIGAVQEDVAKLKAAVGELSGPPAKSKGKSKKIETGSVKLQ